MLDLHELAAGKFAALLARSAERDIFDAHRLLGAKGIDRVKLRLAFVVYGGINRKDWRTVSVDDVKGDVETAWRELVPTLRKDLAPSRTDDGALQAIIQQHPGLLWKAQNVTQHVAGAAKSTT